MNILTVNYSVSKGFFVSCRERILPVDYIQFETRRKGFPIEPIQTTVSSIIGYQVDKVFTVLFGEESMFKVGNKKREFVDTDSFPIYLLKSKDGNKLYLNVDKLAMNMNCEYEKENSSFSGLCISCTLTIEDSKKQRFSTNKTAKNMVVETQKIMSEYEKCADDVRLVFHKESVNPRDGFERLLKECREKFEAAANHLDFCRNYTVDDFLCNECYH